MPLPEEDLAATSIAEAVIPEPIAPSPPEVLPETPVVEIPEPEPDPIVDTMATGSTPQAPVVPEPAPVEAPPSEPEVAMALPPSQPESVGLSATSGSFVVQVASVPSQQQAQTKQDDVQSSYEAILIGLGFDIQEAAVAGKGTFYRVRIGPFDTRPQAVDLCETLKARGQDCYVTTP